MADTTHMLSHSADECTSSIKTTAADSVIVSGYGTGADDSSLSSSPATSMAASVQRRNQHEAFSNTSSGGDTSSAASSIEFFPFMPDHSIHSSSLTPDPTASLDLSTSTDLEPSTTCSPSVNLSSDVDDYMMSMLNTANELSTFSATDCSSSSSLKRLRAKVSRSNLVNSRKAFPPLRSPPTVNGLSADDPQSLKADIDGKRDLKSPLTQDDSFFEAESLLKTLDMTTASYSTSPQKSTPSFAAVDDNYTTNEYVSLVRERSMRNKLKPPGKFDRNANFFRTTTWAANVAPLPPPPLPNTSVPGTPIVSRYRMKTNASIRVRPNTAEPPPLLSSGKAVMENEYFSHGDENPTYVSSLNRKASWLLKKTHLTVRQPAAVKSANGFVSNGCKKLIDAEKRFKPLIIHNFAPTSLPIVDTASANTSISSYSNESDAQASGLPQHFLESDFNEETYYIDRMPADQLDFARENAVQCIGKHIENNVMLKVKQFSQKFDVIKTFFTKFGRTALDSPVDGLFGMPLSMVQAEHGDGKVFPQFVLDIMAFLSEHAPVVDGMFRRCGSQKRILEMRTVCHAMHVKDNIPTDMLTLNQINDLTDLLKQYLRALPERLVNCDITNAVANIVTSGYSEKQQIKLLKCVMLILHDEQRDALLVLIDFLSHVASKSSHNFMTVDNLVVCTLPTIFFQNETATPVNQSRRARNKTVGPLNLQEAAKYAALRQALGVMIKNRGEMRLVSSELLDTTLPPPQRKKKNPMLPIHTPGDAHALRCFVAELCNQFDEGWKHWTSDVTDENGITFATRDVDDDVTLKSNRVQIVISGSPSRVYHVLSQNRTRWDGLVLHMPSPQSHFQTIEDIRQTDFVAFGHGVVKHSILTRVCEEHMIGSGGAFIAEKSTKNVFGGINENVDLFHNVILIFPDNGRSIVNHIVRMDIKGKSTSWYEKTFKQLLISQMRRVKDLVESSSRGSLTANV